MTFDALAVALTAMFAVLAVVGGGVLTLLGFRLVDRDLPPAPAEAQTDSVITAAQTLRGGAWIGALERMAIFAGLVAHWPEAIAIVLAVKGLGRYPELKSGDTSAVAERFIIGTFISVLWACACAGMTLWVLS